ncbi:O-methyltransferase [Flavobacteriales bacterium]|nr:O-methyltransferase [Flavobacteriales bacterium]
MDDPLLQYAEANSTPETNVLKSLRIKTWQTVLSPQMLSDSVQGSFLANISRMIRPRHVLELGTYSGYSTICLSAGLQSEGTIDTIEPNDELHAIQEEHWKKAGIFNQVHRHTCEALLALPNLNGPYDLVWIDADKLRTPAYVQLCLNRTRIGGWILVDNVLWWGKVLPDHPAPDETALALRKMTEDLASRKSIRTTLLPMRDGLLMIEKLSD